MKGDLDRTPAWFVVTLVALLLVGSGTAGVILWGVVKLVLWVTSK